MNLNRLPCIEEEKLANKSFSIKHAMKINIHQLRVCKQKTTKSSPFEARFGRKPKTPLSIISRQTTEGESKALQHGPCRPIPLTGTAVQVNLAPKTHGKR